MSSRPRLLDLFCCAGCAARGYDAAGWDVYGVDTDAKALKRYPYASHHGDVLAVMVVLLSGGTVPFVTPGGVVELALSDFAGIHASPPCQFGTELRHAKGTRKDHVNFIPATRVALEQSGLPWVIENVEDVARAGHLGDHPTRLCGSMFGLGAAGFQLQRHRYFQTSFPMPQLECRHRSPVIGIYGAHVRCRSKTHGGRGTKDFVGYDKPRLAAEAMGVEGLTMAQLSEGIPPAYTQFIGLIMKGHANA